MPKPKRLPTEVVLRQKDHEIVLSRPRAQVVLRSISASGKKSTIALYPFDSIAEVQLFLGPNGHRKVLRLEHDIGIDLGEGVTSLLALAECREIARLIERNLEIRVADYRDDYFADAPPMLYAYVAEDEAAVSEFQTLVDHAVARPSPSRSQGDEDITVDNKPAI